MMIAAIISLRCSARHARLDTTQLRINGTIGACVAKVCVRECARIHRFTSAKWRARKRARARAVAVAAARSEEKIEEARTLYCVVNFIIGERARYNNSNKNNNSNGNGSRYCTAVSRNYCVCFRCETYTYAIPPRQQQWLTAD